ncbi:hypothetical protein C8Q78DRAFT_981766, partial [Trametes maxima]
MSFSRRQPVPRPVSTPPTSSSLPSAREPAGTTTRKTRAKKPTASQEAWVEAEQVIPDLETAKDFLRGATLIPEGAHAVTGESLVSGLLHFAFTGPSHELARRGLIAFAYLAKNILDNGIQGAVSDAVVERAEDQLRIRLDHHTSHVEDRVEELVGSVERMKQEMGCCAAELREAGERVRGAEEVLREAHKIMATQPGLHRGGESSPPQSVLTIDSAPVRVHRAATLADLLQRQVLVRGASLRTEDGARINDAEALARARNTLEELTRAGLSPPGRGAIEQAKILPHEDAVFTASSIEMARWLLKPAVAKPFARKMGMTAQVIE